MFTPRLSEVLASFALLVKSLVSPIVSSIEICVRLQCILQSSRSILATVSDTQLLTRAGENRWQS